MFDVYAVYICDHRKLIKHVSTFASEEEAKRACRYETHLSARYAYAKDLTGGATIFYLPLPEDYYEYRPGRQW